MGQYLVNFIFVMVLVVLAIKGSSSFIRSNNDRKVKLSLKTIEVANIKRIIRHLKSSSQCVKRCHIYEWCRLVCHMNSTSCMMSAIVVSPRYIETRSSPFYTCHTNHLEDYGIVNIYQHFYTGGHRHPTFLFDGLWPRHANEHSYAFNACCKYLTVDLGQIRIISSITIRDTASPTIFTGTKLGKGKAGDYTGYTNHGKVAGNGPTMFLANVEAQFVGISDGTGYIFRKYIIIA